MFARTIILALLPLALVLSSCEVNETVTPNLQTGVLDVQVLPPTPGQVPPAASPTEAPFVLLYPDGEDFRDELGDAYNYSLSDGYVNQSNFISFGELNPGNYFVYGEQLFSDGFNDYLYSGGTYIQIQSDIVSVADIELKLQQ